MQHFCSRLETCTPTSQQGTHTRGQPAHATQPLCGSPSRSRTSRRGCRQPRCDAMRCDAPTPPTTPSSRSQRSRSLPPPKAHSPRSGKSSLESRPGEHLTTPVSSAARQGGGGEVLLIAERPQSAALPTAAARDFLSARLLARWSRCESAEAAQPELRARRAPAALQQGSAPARRAATIWQPPARAPRTQLPIWQRPALTSPAAAAAAPPWRRRQGAVRRRLSCMHRGRHGGGSQCAARPGPLRRRRCSGGGGDGGGSSTRLQGPGRQEPPARPPSWNQPHRAAKPGASLRRARRDSPSHRRSLRRGRMGAEEAALPARDARCSPSPCRPPSGRRRAVGAGRCRLRDRGAAEGVLPEVRDPAPDGRAAARGAGRTRFVRQLMSQPVYAGCLGCREMQGAAVPALVGLPAG